MRGSGAKLVCTWAAAVVPEVANEPNSNVRAWLMSSGRRPRRSRGRRAGLPEPLAELAARLRRRPPQVVVTCARGSSAHAATFAKHLIERYLGIPVAAAAPNIASVYRRRLRLEDQLFLAVSQSGRSDDLIELARRRERRGRADRRRSSTTPAARWPRPATSCCRSRAGPERSVAATKTLRRDARGAAAAGRRLDRRRRRCDAALDRLPERLAAAAELDWSAALDALGRRGEPDHDRPRPDARDRARGGAEAEGDLQPPCRGVQRRRVSARADGAGLDALPDPDVHADRCGGRRHAHARRRPAPQGRGAVRRRGRAGRARAVAGARRDHPETDAICLIQSFYAMAGRGLPHGSAPMSTGPAICRRSPARDERQAPSRGAGRHRLRRRDGAPGLRGRDRRRRASPRLVAAQRNVPAAMPTRTLAGGAWLAPGFIDVQVNGGGDVLFNDEPTPEGIAAIVAAHRRFGTTALLPTLITDTPGQDARRARCGAPRRACQPGRARHPFRRAVPVAGQAGRARSRDDPPARRSRHRAALRAAGALHARDPGAGRVPPGFIARLAAAGVRVCARPFHGDL